jgi:enterochelin esterase family protein
MKKLSIFYRFFLPCLLVFPAVHTIAQDRPVFRMPRAIVSPELLPDNKVTFRLYAKDAQSVAVSGDWMPGFGASEPLVKNDTGMWSVTLGPLSPELYTYGFIVNGVRVLDPGNPRVIRDGTRNLSMFLIPGTASDLYEVKDVPHGNLAKVWYPSPTLNLTRRMYVYTPAGYSEGKTEYPVLYLLHGGGGDEDAWTTLGRTCQIMDNLIAQGKAKPMIVVMTNGNPGQSAAPGDGPAMKAAGGNPGDMGRGKFEASLVKDVIPYIESHYRVLKGKDNRAVSGLSMGGMQTMNLSTTFPEMFSYYGVMSMGLVDNSARGIPPDPELDKKIDLLKNSGYKLYWIACGTDDFLYASAKNLLKKLDEHQFKYVYRESTGGHTWTNWRIYLSELAPQLFK